MAIPFLQLISIGLLPSALKKLYYRSRGARIGKRVKLSLLSVIDAENIEIGNDVHLGLFSFVSAKNVSLGNRSRINSFSAIDTGRLSLGADSVIMEQVVVGGMKTPRSELCVGKRVKIFPFSFLNTTEKITIEDEAGVGGGNYIFTHGTWQSMLDGYPGSFGPVTIKKRAWLPWRVFVMPNVTIGENAMVAAGAVVSMNVPDLGIASGVPAIVRDVDGRHLRRMNDKRRHRLLLDIFMDFVELMEYEGKSAKLVEVNGGVDIHWQSSCLKYRTEMSVDAVGNLTNEMYIWLRKSEHLRVNMLEESLGWFDLETRDTRFFMNRPWQEIRDFLGRYGIRFNIDE